MAGSVKDSLGASIRFRTKREAEKAVNDVEADVRAGRYRNPSAGRIAFGEYVNLWCPRQDLAVSTMQNYRLTIEGHLLPEFDNVALADISRAAIATWEKKERASGSPRAYPGRDVAGPPVRGRNAAGRADACWLPIAQGLTPHSLRHFYRTLMEELRTPLTPMDDQMGHSDGSMGARYSQATLRMIAWLLDALTEVWLEALAARRELHPHSPVATLDRLLKEVP